MTRPTYKCIFGSFPNTGPDRTTEEMGTEKGVFERWGVGEGDGRVKGSMMTVFCGL